MSEGHDQASLISFENVVCGVDTSPESQEAVRQAKALAAENARLWAVSVWDPGLAIHGGVHASEVMTELRDDCISALRDAQGATSGLEPILVKGPAVAGLLAALTNLEADLVSVGSHGTSRPAGVVFGSVATAMAHHAPCSVLIARDAAESFPRAILHAGDGSPESLDAARVAGRSGRIATRRSSPCTSVRISTAQG